MNREALIELEKRYMELGQELAEGRHSLEGLRIPDLRRSGLTLVTVRAAGRSNRHPQHG